MLLSLRQKIHLYRLNTLSMNVPNKITLTITMLYYTRILGSYVR